MFHEAGRPGVFLLPQRRAIPKWHLHEKRPRSQNPGQFLNTWTIVYFHIDSQVSVGLLEVFPKRPLRSEIFLGLWAGWERLYLGIYLSLVYMFFFLLIFYKRVICMLVPRPQTAQRQQRAQQLGRRICRRRRLFRLTRVDVLLWY